jgi:hypothetical protein
LVGKDDKFFSITSLTRRTVMACHRCEAGKRTGRRDGGGSATTLVRDWGRDYERFGPSLRTNLNAWMYIKDQRETINVWVCRVYILNYYCH